MASRTSRNSTRETTSRNSHDVDRGASVHRAQQDSQQHLALAAEAASTLLRSAEVWSQVQLQAVQRSARSWRQAAERLRTASSPLDVIGAQNQIVMDAMLQFLQLGQDLVQAGAAAQPRAAELAQDETRATAESAEAAMQTPMMQAWQAMVDPLGLRAAVSLNGLAH